MSAKHFRLGRTEGLGAAEQILRDLAIADWQTFAGKAALLEAAKIIADLRKDGFALHTAPDNPKA